MVTVESPGELRRLARIAEGLGRRQPILLRAAVSESAPLERVRLVGDDGAGKFGMDGADLRASAAEAVASPWLEPLGMHAFGASNVLDAGALAAHVEATVDRGPRIGSRRRLPAAAGRCRWRPRHPVRGRTRTPLDVGALGTRLAGPRCPDGRRPRHPRDPRPARARPLPRRRLRRLRRPRRRPQVRRRPPRRHPRRRHPPRAAAGPRGPGASRRVPHRRRPPTPSASR